MTSYTIREVPDGLWTYYKRYTQGNLEQNYGSLNERFHDLIAADVAANKKHRRGIIEMAIEEGIITEDEFNDAYDLTLPGQTKSEEKDNGDEDED